MGSCNSTFSSSVSFAPSPPVPGVGHDALWNRTYDGERGRDVIELSGGGYALIGAIDGSPLGRSDVWILGTDVDGNKLWSKALGGSDIEWGTTLAECSSGGFIIGGEKWGSNNYDMWFGRTNAFGFHVWSKTWGGSENEKCESVIECSSGGFVLLGSTNSFGAGDYDVWLIRTDASGNHLWNKTFGGSASDTGEGLIECSSGGFAIIGSTSSFSSGTSSPWLIRTDASGNHLWDVVLESGVDEEYGMELIECSSSGFAIVSYSDSWPGLWLIRTDATGNHLWTQSFNGDQYTDGLDIVECAAGGFAIQAECVRGYALDVWVIRTDELGNVLWSQTYGGSSTEYSGGIEEVSGGGFVVVGYFLIPGTIWLLRIPDPPLWWVESPENQIVEYNADFNSQLEADSLWGIDAWWVNDTVKFDIDGAGLLTNAITLSVGNHGVQVWVNDSSDDRLNTNITITVEPSAPPTWVEVPTDQVVELGSSFTYDLNATDRSGIGSWWLTGGVPFTIDGEGIITNNGFLSLGDYELQVWVSDTLGNEMNSIFHVQVQDHTPPTWVETPTNLLVEYGSDVSYDLKATDLSGIHTWWIDDTVRFSITQTGVIRGTSLEIDDYPLTVWVNDSQGNTLSSSFVILVRDTQPPIWLESPYDLFGTPDSFEYQLEAFDLSGISNWSISPSDDFQISHSGLLTNRRRLNLGVFYLTVFVNDSFDNSLQDSIRITIYDPVLQVITTWLVIIATFVAMGIVAFVAIRIQRYFRTRTDRRTTRWSARPIAPPSASSEKETVGVTHDRQARPGRFRCIECGVLITGTMDVCSTCGTRQKRCIVCQAFVGKEENFLQCPHCKQLAHKAHLLEWLKVKGLCPYCKQKLSHRDLS